MEPEDEKQKFERETMAFSLAAALTQIMPMLADLEECTLRQAIGDWRAEMRVDDIQKLVAYAVDRAAGDAERCFRKAREMGLHALDCDDPKWRGLDGAPPEYHLIAKIAPVLYNLQRQRYEANPALLRKHIDEEAAFRAERFARTEEGAKTKAETETKGRKGKPKADEPEPDPQPEPPAPAPAEAAI